MRFTRIRGTIFRRQPVDSHNIAIESEIEEAVIEGIELRILAAPIKVLSSKGKIKAIECIRMKLGDKRRP